MWPFKAKFEPLFIGKFQLENLLRNEVPFKFFNLCEDELSDEQKQGVLCRAEKLSLEAIIELEEKGELVKESPIILICKNGKVSAKLAQQLDRKGFINTYVVEAGFKGII